MLNFWLQILFLAVGMACWVVSQKWTFGQLRWSKGKDPLSFWGSNSNARKYKLVVIKGTSPRPWVKPSPDTIVPDTTKESFPMSTGALVFVTDGYHLMQFIALRCFYAILALSTPAFWWVFLALWVVGSGLMWAYGEIFGRNG